MNEKLIVRSVAPEDLAAWRTLWDGYNAFYGRDGATALPEPVTLTTWARFFDGHEPVHGLVAERAGIVVGLAHYIFHRSTTQIGPICYLQDLFTAPQARGIGVGRALISAVYEAAAAGGARGSIGKLMRATSRPNRSTTRSACAPALSSTGLNYD